MWDLLLQCMDSLVVVGRLSCAKAYRIFQDQGLNPCPLHWQMDSQLLDHQESLAWLLIVTILLSKVLPNQSWVHSPDTQQSQSTVVCGELVFIAGTKQGEQAAHSPNSWSPWWLFYPLMTFKESLKTKWGRGSQGMLSLLLGRENPMKLVSKTTVSSLTSSPHSSHKLVECLVCYAVC